MKDTPGWASPGSAPSDGQEPGASGPAEPSDSADSAQQPPADQQAPGPKWSKEQPPAGQWSAPTGTELPRAVRVRQSLTPVRPRIRHSRAPSGT
ncbi:hypothetical protein ACWDSB_34830, partial [Streptomyces sp. NPDC003514]